MGMYIHALFNNRFPFNPFPFAGPIFRRRVDAPLLHQRFDVFVHSVHAMKLEIPKTCQGVPRSAFMTESYKSAQFDIAEPFQIKLCNAVFCIGTIVFCSVWRFWQTMTVT